MPHPPAPSLFMVRPTASPFSLFLVTLLRFFYDSPATEDLLIGGRYSRFRVEGFTPFASWSPLFFAVEESIDRDVGVVPNSFGQSTLR